MVIDPQALNLWPFDQTAFDQFAQPWSLSYNKTNFLLWSGPTDKKVPKNVAELFEIGAKPTDAAPSFIFIV